MVEQYIDPQFILTRDKISQPIGTYGGIFMTGYENSKNSHIVVKAGWELTQSDNAIKVIENIYEYYETDKYIS